MLVGRAHGEIDLSHLVGRRLVVEGDARGHVRIVDVDERLRAARQRERLLEFRERNMPLRRADRGDQQKPRCARFPRFGELRVAVELAQIGARHRYRPHRRRMRLPA